MNPIQFETNGLKVLIIEVPGNSFDFFMIENSMLSYWKRNGKRLWYSGDNLQLIRKTKHINN